MQTAEAFSEIVDDFSLYVGRGEERGDAPPDGPSRVAFGTVVREAPLSEGGELVILNWEDKSIEAKVTIRPRNPTIGEDPDPQGNARGCRGVRWTDGTLIAASYHTLELYDEELNAVGEINDGLMVGLHEIELTDERTVWVTSTAIDAALEYDLENKTRRRAFWPREMEPLQEALGLIPMSLDKEADHRLTFLAPSKANSESHLHLNAVEPHDGAVYGLSNAFGAVINFTTEEIVLRHEGLKKGHNLKILDDGLVLVNDTFGRAVRAYDLEQGTLRKSIDLTRYRWVRRLMRREAPKYWGTMALKKIGWVEGTVPRPLFVRGLALDGPHLFVGVSPAAILQINWETETLVDAYQYSTDVEECIHGLDVIG